MGLFLQSEKCFFFFYTSAFQCLLLAGNAKLVANERPTHHGLNSVVLCLFVPSLLVKLGAVLFFFCVEFWTYFVSIFIVLSRLLLRFSLFPSGHIPCGHSEARAGQGKESVGVIH